MVATQEGSLASLGRLVGLDRSKKAPPVERERLSPEDLIDLGAFPFADGYALFPFSDADELDHLDGGEKIVDRITVYFQTIANIRKEQRDAKISVDPSTKKIGRSSKSVYELSPLIAVWDEENGSRLGYSLSTWDKDSDTFEYKGFLPLLRLGSIVDQDGAVSPLTHDQLSDALAYLVEYKVLSPKKSQDVLDRHGIASRQYQAALEIESRRVRIQKLPEHDNRPLWEVSPLIDAYNPDDDHSVEDNIRRVLILADQVRAYGDIDWSTGKPGMTVSIKKENSTQVAIVSIPSLGINKEILRDHYESDEKIINGKMITEPDLEYALGYLEDSGVITLEQKVLIGGRGESEGLFKPQKLRDLTPLKDDPEEKFRELVPEYPYQFELDEDSIKRNKKKEVLTLVEHYPLGRFDVYIGQPLARLDFNFDVVRGKDINYVFHLGLDGLGKDIHAKHVLAQAYFAYANTRSGGQVQRGRIVHVPPRNVPQLYRNEQDDFILVMNYKGSDINAMFTKVDQHERRVIPQQLDGRVRQAFQQTLQAMVTSVYSDYLAEDIRITQSIVEHPRGDRR